MEPDAHCHAMPPSLQADNISPEILLLLKKANVASLHAQQHLNERAGYQMKEYVRVLNHRLDREHHSVQISSIQTDKIKELLFCLDN